MRQFYLLSLFLLLSLSAFCQVPQGYYSKAEGKKGQALKEALYQTIKGHKKYPYSSKKTDVWDILKKTDADPNNPGKVLMIYSGYSLDAEKEYKAGWNREHVWAKSRGDFGTKMGPGTDLHNLKPADVSLNSSRSNKDFDEGGKIVRDNSPARGYDGTTSNRSDRDSWEPRDEVKGDVARILFYMATRYEGENGEPDLVLVDQITSGSSKNPKHGKLSTLLKWHKQDPVDDFERNRNNVVYSFQGNRNPYIDHPEYVSLIWDNPTAIGPVPEDKEGAANKIGWFQEGENLHLTIPFSAHSLKMYNLAGHEVRQVAPVDKHTIIDISQLKPGLYLIKVSNQVTKVLIH